MAPPTMQDVAAQVGVSRTAVSFVLNGEGRKRGISRKVERNILEAARELGYRPSLVARSLASRRTMTIGLLLPHMAVTYGPPLAEAIERAAEQQGYQVILGHHHGDPERFVKALDAMLGWKVDGLAVVPLVGMKDLPIYPRFAATSTPKVLLETDAGGRDHHLVTTDVVQAMRMALEHLLKLGHRRIALFNGADALLESRHREQAYRQVMREARIEVDESLIVNAAMNETPEMSLACARRMLGLSPRPTAAVAVSAQRAEAMFYACEAMGLTIPEDLSAVVVTGARFTDFQRVHFSSVRLTYQQVGEAAFSVLKEEIDHGPLAPRRVLTAPVWEPGASTRALPPADHQADQEKASR